MKKNHLIKRSLVILAGIGVAGCVSSTAPNFEEVPNYPLGYSDGCSSATETNKNFSDKITRDESLFSTDKGYRAGWRQGYAACNRNPEVIEGDGLYRGQVDPYL